VIENNDAVVSRTAEGRDKVLSEIERKMNKTAIIASKRLPWIQNPRSSPQNPRLSPQNLQLSQSRRTEPNPSAQYKRRADSQRGTRKRACKSGHHAFPTLALFDLDPGSAAVKLGQA